jgi:hypothetical protein
VLHILVADCPPGSEIRLFCPRSNDPVIRAKALVNGRLRRNFLSRSVRFRSYPAVESRRNAYVHVEGGAMACPISYRQRPHKKET